MPELQSIAGGKPEKTPDERAVEASASALTKINSDKFKALGIDPGNFEDRKLIRDVYTKFLTDPNIGPDDVIEMGDLAPLVLEVIKESTPDRGPQPPATIALKPAAEEPEERKEQPPP